MKKLLLLAGLVLHGITVAYAQLNVKAAEALIKRVVPEHYRHFSVEPLAIAGNKDAFEIESLKGKIILRGANGVSVASALHHYLKTWCNTEISWNTTRLDLPKKLPSVPQKTRISSPHQYRYYFNYCTFNYSLVWWDWERWEKEIDWMALHGINLPLALTGQDAVWQRVYREMGFSDDELNAFFSGPAFSAFNWMGLVDGWGGPLPQNWIDSQEKLQKKILERERSLGMKPVLPAFNGHVPPAFQDKFPDSKVDRIKWVGFHTTMLHPTDSMFTVIGGKFIEELRKTFGTDHYYSADAFIEVTPPSGEPEYVNAMGNTMHKSMAVADPDATWVMQGWMFHHKRQYWTAPLIKSFLDGIPDDGILVLDLWSENNPVWSRTEAYYGKPWLWCMLHNFGGNISLYGRMPVVSTIPAETLRNPDAGNISGIGLTMEGIDQNPAIYALMLENAWTENPIDVDDWLDGYIKRRYGKQNEEADKAWEILKNTVYDGNVIPGGPESIISGRPTFEKSTAATRTQHMFYNPADLLPAWEHLIKAIPGMKKTDGMEYDVVDVTRQVLANYANELQQKYAAAALDKRMEEADTYSRQFLELIDDIDKTVAARPEFLLGVWLENAKAHGKSEEERRLYEMNARMIITLWGDQHGLHDYSNRQWSGLLKGFYKPRWENFFEYVKTCHANNKEVNMDEFNESSKVWERNWVHSNEVYAQDPQGDALTVSTEMFEKYYPVISVEYNSKGN